MLVVHDDAGAPVRAFDRKSDGMLVPWSKDRMKTARKGYNFTLQIMEPVVEAAEEGESKQVLRKAI